MPPKAKGMPLTWHAFWGRMKKIKPNNKICHLKLKANGIYALAIATAIKALPTAYISQGNIIFTTLLSHTILTNNQRLRTISPSLKHFNFQCRIKWPTHGYGPLANGVKQCWILSHFHHTFTYLGTLFAFKPKDSYCCCLLKGNSLLARKNYIRSLRSLFYLPNPSILLNLLVSWSHLKFSKEAHMHVI